MESLEHEASLSNQVAEQQRIDLEKEESEKNILKSQVKKVEKEHESSKAQHKKNVDLLRETLNELTKANNELKECIKTKDAHLASLTEDDDADASENEEINIVADVHNKEVNSRVTMRSNNTLQKCLACDKMFKANSDLEKHIRDKHTEAECHMCHKKFPTKKDVEEHICYDNEVVPQVCEKTYCHKEFISTAALKKHMKSTHFGNQRNV